MGATILRTLVLLYLSCPSFFFLHHFFKRHCSSSFSFCCHHPRDSACPPVPLLTPAHVAPLRLPLRPLACAHALSHLSIVNGFCVPIKDEHKVMLVRALIPLHKVRMLQGYVTSVVRVLALCCWLVCCGR